MSKCILALTFWLLASLAHAAIVVDQLQPPAWVERGAQRTPLQPGMPLMNDDVVATGAGARLLLRMSEGSTVKLGEQARLQLDSLESNKPGVFSAGINVLAGAFRYTTAATAKLLNRDVNVKVAAITVGIRGTDIWGKSDHEKDLVCLLDGKIEVSAAGEPPILLTEPLAFYIAPKNAKPLPVDKVPVEKLAVWGQETEIAAGRGVIAAAGRWQVMVSKATDQAAALKDYDTIRGLGYAAEIQPGNGRYTVRIRRFSSQADAQFAADQLRVAGFAEARASGPAKPHK